MEGGIVIQRRTALKRSRLKPRTAPVRKKRPGGPRRGPAGIPAEEWRNPKSLRFLRAKGTCRACQVKPLNPYEVSGYLRGVLGCDPMHGPVNGGSSKGPDAGAIPGCRIHHDEQTAIGWPAFEGKYGFSRAAVAAQWWAQFLDQERR